MPRQNIIDMKGIRLAISCLLSMTLVTACSNDPDTEEPKPATTTTETPSQTPVVATKGTAKKDAVALGLKAKVQTFTESIFRTNDNGGKGNLANRNVFTFNPDGDRVEIQSFNQHGAMVSTTKFTYDENKHITMEEIYLANGKIGSKFICKTDSAGRKIEQKDVALKKNPLLNLTYKFEYDENGNMTRWLSLRGNNQPAWNYFYTYDSDGNRIEWTVKSLDGTLIQKNVYRYDNKNNLVEEEALSATGTLKNKYTYKYQLDKNNNWTRQVKSENNKPVEIRERTYGYFN